MSLPEGMPLGSPWAASPQGIALVVSARKHKNRWFPRVSGERGIVGPKLLESHLENDDLNFCHKDSKPKSFELG